MASQAHGLTNWHPPCSTAREETSSRAVPICVGETQIKTVEREVAEDERAEGARDEPVAGGRRLPFGEVDLAPVALFRIVYGLLLFNWIWQLYPDLGAFFTDEGFLPRRTLFASFPDRLSLLHLFGDWWQVALFWGAALVVAVALTVGYRTRLAALLAFLVVISFEGRNPLILDGSDLVFRVVPFWLIFANAGGMWSVDAASRRARGEVPSQRGWALPVFILQLQIAWIYLATGIEKLGGTKWPDGTALYYALQLAHTFGRAWADFIVRIPALVRIGTLGTLAVELGFLPAVFFPLGQPYLRLVAVAAAAALHLGIFAFMNVGNFPIVMLAALIVFLPASLVRGAVARAGALFSRARPLHLFYDGDCPLCRRTAAFLGAADLYGTVTLVDFRRGHVPNVISREALERRIHVLDEDGRVATGFAAFARIGRGMPLLVPLWIVGAVPGLSWLAERAYDVVAERRLLLSGCPGERCELHPVVAPVPVPTPRRELIGWLRPAGAIALVVVALATLGTAMPRPLAAYATPAGVTGVARYLSVDQRWDMFSPDPANADGWLRAPGMLADGTLVDLMGPSGRPLPHDPQPIASPDDATSLWADPLYSRWTKVTERIAMSAYQDYRLEYGRSICRARNLHLRPGESPLLTFDVYYTQRVIGPPGTPDRFQDIHVWSHKC